MSRVKRRMRKAGFTANSVDIDFETLEVNILLLATS